MTKPDFWQNQSQAKAVGQKAESLKSIINDWEGLDQDVKQLLALAKTAVEEEDDSLGGELDQEFKKLIKKKCIDYSENKW